MKKYWDKRHPYLALIVILSFVSLGIVLSGLIIILILGR